MRLLVLTACIGLLYITGGMSQVQIGQDLNGSFENNLYGQEIAFSDDGKVLVILSTDENDIKQIEVFKESEGVWSTYGEFESDIYNEDSVKNIAISGDGSTLAFSVNGTKQIQDFIFTIRLVHVFRYSDGLWIKKGKEIEQGPSFSSISLSYNGNIIALGDPCTCGFPPIRARTSTLPPYFDGIVRVYGFEFDNWTQIGDAIEDESGEEDFLGSDIDLSSEGDLIAIASIKGGELYKNISGNWTLVNEAPTIGEEGFSCSAISISSDGGIMACQRNTRNEEDFKSLTKVFALNGNERNQIGNDIIEDLTFDYYFTQVDLSEDGQILAIGVISTDNGSVFKRAIIYKYNGDQWVKQGEISKEITSDESESINIDLASNSMRIAIGDWLNDEIAENAGQVRVFELDNVLSVDEFYSTEIRLFPNPTSNTLTVDLPSGLELKSFKIINGLGQIVIDNPSKTIGVSNLSQGLYMARITTNKGIHNKKVIIK